VRGSARRENVFTGLLFLLPVAFLFILYWYGLKNWFEQDDFAWLGLHANVYDVRSFLTAMFAPMAQGTIRPWSERGFFLLFYWLFQSNALPYHILVFVTQTANLALLAVIMHRLTGSRIAAVAGPVLWTANTALITPLCWVSDYNQILCAFFLLLAFLLYLQDRYWLQFGVFVLGFGALELNVVYPAIVLAFVVTCRLSRARVLRTVPLFAVSFAYYALHTAVAPRQTTGVYALHFDLALPGTFWAYCQSVFAPSNAHQPLGTVLLFVGVILLYALFEAWKGRLLPVFFLGWFVITLAPILPLRDHISDYYLAIPSIGVGAILALALSTPVPLVRFAAIALASFYLFIQVPVDSFGARWYFGHTRAVRNLVWGVKQAQLLHPGKTILLTDVSDDLYQDAIAHSAFRTLGISGVYLAPEQLPQVQRLDSQNPDAIGYVLPAGAVVHALEKESLVVYSATGEHLRSVTSAYEQTAGQRFGWDNKKNVPNRVDVASPLMAYLLGSTWYSPEGTFRWMPSRASLLIGGPRTANAKLVLSGYCPPEQTQSAPLIFSVLVDGEFLSEAKISKPETSFSRTFSLPPSLLDRNSVEVTVAVDRTLSKGAENNPLGLAFGVFEIR